MPYFNDLVKTKLQSNSAPRILIDDEGNILKHNLPNTITTALIQTLQHALLAMAATPLPLASYNVKFFITSDETYLIEINKQHQQKMNSIFCSCFRSC